MYICKVIGKVVSTQKNEKLMGSSIVLIRMVSLSKEKNEVTQSDAIFAAVDAVGCGTGNLVLVTSGANALFACKTAESPVDMVVVGIIDSGLGE
ncbi:Ethanolamine utilization protein EutN [bioreactor metagenome]|uniref:Ethanolamine utilization protein EutN n=1 Tax=bioreactor metagenome TaxID=1076179 RepID=A0A644ZEQ7_9ZZZZ